jgi:hypothetical protein
VIGANRLAYWLWSITEPDQLFGFSAFHIYSSLIGDELSVKQNLEMFEKKIAVLHRHLAMHPESEWLYGSFITKVKQYPQLREKLNRQQKPPEQEWSASGEWHYPLTVTTKDVFGNRQSNKFNVQVSRIVDNGD